MNDEPQQSPTADGELADLRRRVSELEAMETNRRHAQQLAAEARERSHRRYAAIFSGLPVALALLLLIANRPYMIRPFHPDTIRCALPMLGAVLLLSALAFPALLGSFSVIRSGRSGLGLLLVALVFAFMTIPAVLIVLLGPAAFILLQSELGGIIQGR